MLLKVIKVSKPPILARKDLKVWDRVNGEEVMKILTVGEIVDIVYDVLSKDLIKLGYCVKLTEKEAKEVTIDKEEKPISIEKQPDKTKKNKK